MRILVVDDEAPARARLIAAIRGAAPEAVIAGEVASVAEGVAWLASHPLPDLLFLDIQLGDGLSFEILESGPVTCPAIFVTAYDEYLLDAFKATGIEYLLKPVRAERVHAAIEKYRQLRRHFRVADEVRQAATRERLLVRKGLDLISLRTSEVAYFYTSGKLVFLVSRTGSRYLVDRALGALEAELDPAQFFRANRAYLVHIDAVVRSRPYGKGRMLIELQPPAGEEVVVSQERAGALREWLGGMT